MSTFQELVDKQIKIYSREESAGYNPLTRHFIYSPEVELPVWLTPFVVPEVPEINLRTTEITNEGTLRRWKVPRQYRGVQFTRRIFLGPGGHYALVEQVSYLDIDAGYWQLVCATSVVPPIHKHKGDWQLHVIFGKGVGVSEKGRFFNGSLMEPFEDPIPLTMPDCNSC